ncbi:MAG: phasin family protein [Alphaproteobacteria bacterium]|nr:phasin family protein [Alphaproteobacteria bacterium]
MPSPQDEFMRMFAEMKLPAMPDMSAITEAHKRNIEALTTANRLAMEGAQAVARRNMEIMQQALGEMNETIRAFTTEQTPQAKAARQAELMKSAYEQAMINMREISDLIQKSNTEAMDVLNSRVSTALDEMRGLMK